MSDPGRHASLRWHHKHVDITMIVGTKSDLGSIGGKPGECFLPFCRSQLVGYSSRFWHDPNISTIRKSDMCGRNVRILNYSRIYLCHSCQWDGKNKNQAIH